MQVRTGDKSAALSHAVGKQQYTHEHNAHRSQCKVDFCAFRAQFGQSRSFNSLSHKNLIMNMEPLVPALPSTNEYEDTATDNGRIRLTLHTLPRLPAGDLWEVTWCLPCVAHARAQPFRQKALIEQLMLPSLHQSCLPGDTNDSMLKIPFP